MTPTGRKEFLIGSLRVRQDVTRRGLEMIDDALRAIVDLMTSLTRAQAVVNVFPAVLKCRVESTKVLPGSTAKKRASRGDDLKAARDRRGWMVSGEPGINVVRERIKADGDSGMLNGVIREEELRPNHRRGGC